MVWAIIAVDNIVIKIMQIAFIIPTYLSFLANLRHREHQFFEKQFHHFFGSQMRDNRNNRENIFSVNFVPTFPWPMSIEHYRWFPFLDICNSGRPHQDGDNLHIAGKTTQIINGLRDFPGLLNARRTRFLCEDQSQYIFFQILLQVKLFLL